MSTFDSGCSCSGGAAPATYFVGDERPVGISVTPSDLHFVSSATYSVINAAGASVASGSSTVTVAPYTGDPVGGPYTQPPTSTLQSGLISWNTLGRFIVRYVLTWDDGVVDHSASQEINVVVLAS